MMLPLPKIEMSVFETILSRRSIRHYKAESLNNGTIRSVIEAAVRAPTAMHQEPWLFVVVQDKQVLEDISNRAKPLILAEIRLSAAKNVSHSLDIFDNPDFNIFYNAGTLVLICGRSDLPFFQADCWLAAENLMLAACAMGLGSCVIGSALSALRTPEFKTQLNIPSEFTAVAPIVLGYPEGDSVPTQRKSPLILGLTRVH